MESEASPVAGSKKNGKLGRKTTKGKAKQPRKAPSPSKSGDESDSPLKKELKQSGFGIEGLRDNRKKTDKS